MCEVVTNYTYLRVCTILFERISTGREANVGGKELDLCVIDLTSIPVNETVRIFEVFCHCSTAGITNIMVCTVQLSIA